MLVFISCAKTMAARCSVVVPEVTVPKFETEAVRNALEMSQYSVSELERLLRVNTKIAAENRLRFHDFCSEENRSMPAVCAYTGAVFKRILPKDFSAEDFRYAQEHLRITSFLYFLPCNTFFLGISGNGITVFIQYFHCQYAFLIMYIGIDKQVFAIEC